MSPSCVAKSVLYGMTICGATLLLVVALASEVAPVVWFLIVPVVCGLLIYALEIKVGLCFQRVLGDLKRYWKWIAIAAAFQVIFYSLLYVVLHGKADSGPLRIAVRFSPVRLVSNLVEELVFRVTGVQVLETWERSLFGETSKSRVIVATSVSFALCHLPGLFRIPSHLMAFEAANIVFCFCIGMVLADLFYESRNVPSVVALHWWVIIQSEVLQLVVYTIASIVR